jgi:hypothetical protein
MIVIASGKSGWSALSRQIRNRWPSSHAKVACPCHALGSDDGTPGVCVCSPADGKALEWRVARDADAVRLRPVNDLQQPEREDDAARR